MPIFELFANCTISSNKLFISLTVDKIIAPKRIDLTKTKKKKKKKRSAKKLLGFLFFS